MATNCAPMPGAGDVMRAWYAGDAMAAAEASRRSPDSADLVVICTLNGEGRVAGSLARAWRAVFARGCVGSGGAVPARRGPARGGAE